MARPGEYDYYAARTALGDGATLGELELDYFRSRLGEPELVLHEAEARFYQAETGVEDPPLAMFTYYRERSSIVGTLDDHMAAFFGNAESAPAFETQSTGTVLLPFTVAHDQPMTMYVVTPTGTTGHRSTLENHLAHQVLGAGRRDAGLSWFALARNAADTSVVAEVVGTAGAQVICAARSADSLVCDTTGVGGESSAAMVGYSPGARADRLVIDASIVHTEIWLGVAHDNAKRTARMAELEALYL